MASSSNHYERVPTTTHDNDNDEQDSSLHHHHHHPPTSSSPTTLLPTSTSTALSSPTSASYPSSPSSLPSSPSLPPPFYALSSSSSSTYTPVPTTTTTPIKPPPILPSSNNDGVFSNLSAKPNLSSSSSSSSSSSHHHPSSRNTNTAASASTASSSHQKELPPSYDSVALDPTPLYPDNIVFTSTTFDPNEEDVLVDGLPVGSMVTFFLTMMVSMTFQFVGFCLTYLLSMTHAGRSGAKAGFGVSLIQLGLSLRAHTVHYKDGTSSPDDDDFGLIIPPNATPDEIEAIITRTQWISYALILLGWILVLKSSLTYLRAKRLEALILATPESMVGA